MPNLCMPSAMTEVPFSISILLQLELDGFLNCWICLFPALSVVPSLELHGKFWWLLLLQLWKGLLWLLWAPDPFLVTAVSTFWLMLVQRNMHRMRREHIWISARGTAVEKALAWSSAPKGCILGGCCWPQQHSHLTFFICLFYFLKICTWKSI